MVKLVYNVANVDYYVIKKFILYTHYLKVLGYWAYYHI